jgi:ribose 5-phosphate isomerase B
VGEIVAIGADHRGFSLKNILKKTLENMHISVIDMGTFSDESVDYPEFAKKVAESVSKQRCSRGILVCGSGIGMSIVANKFPGVRAALCHDITTAQRSRQHNNANILVLGEDVDLETANKMLKVWSETAFEGGRHQRRIDQINELEQQNFK